MKSGKQLKQLKKDNKTLKIELWDRDVLITKLQCELDDQKKQAEEDRDRIFTTFLKYLSEIEDYIAKDQTDFYRGIKYHMLQAFKEQLFLELDGPTNFETMADEGLTLHETVHRNTYGSTRM